MGGPHAAVGEAVPDSRDSLTRAGLSILILVPFRRGLALGGGNYTAGSRSLGPLPELTADLVVSGSGEGLMRWTAVSLAIAFVCVTANQAVAQKTANQVVAQKKVALVIGNDAYVHEARLDNPGRDAGLIAAHLEKLGFELVGDRALRDLDKATTDRMVSLFGAKAQDADVALFYFSGHGTQFDGTNYLLPIDVGPYTRATVGLQALNADHVVRAMEDSRARLKIALLDACRSPFKGQGGGLGSMRAPAGTVIGFATQPNNTAKQGPPGGVSPYAEALAHFFRVKGLEIFAFFNEVSQMVRDATGNEQEPWVSYSAIRGKAYINPPEVIVGIPATPPELQG